MSIPKDEDILQKLEEEKAAVQIRPHVGYADATQFARLESEIEAMDERISREKQRAEHGDA